MQVPLVLVLNPIYFKKKIKNEKEICKRDKIVTKENK